MIVLYGLSIQNIPSYVLIFIVVLVFTVTKFLGGEALASCWLHLFVFYFFLILFMMFEVLKKVLLIQVFWDMIACLNWYSLPFYTALYLRRPEPYIYVYGIKLFGYHVSLDIIHATVPPTNMKFDEHGFARNALAVL